MKNQKKTIIMVLSIIFMMLVSTISYAADYINGESFTAGLKTTSTNVTKGSKVEVTIGLKDFVNIGSGVNTFRAKLNYNKEVLSITKPDELTLTSQDIVGINSWGTVMYNPETTLLVVEKGGMVTSNEDIIKITFTVKSDVAIGTSADITLTEVEAAGLDDFTGLGSTLTLTVVEAPAQEPDDEEQDPGEEPDDGEENPGATTCTHEYEWKHNNTQHYQVCKKCNEEKSGSKANHSYSTYTDNGGTTHSSTCTVCSYKLTEAHNFIDNECTHCDAVKVDSGTNEGNGNDDKCNHTYTYTDNKDGTHTVKCTKCGDESKESHSTTQKCSKCGYTPKQNSGSGNSNGGTSTGGNTNGVNNNKDNTTSDNNYSKAGINTVLIVVVGCAVVVAVVLYRKNKKFQDIK